MGLIAFVFHPSRLVGWHATSPAKASSVPGITTHRQSAIIRGGEAACPGAEVTGHELIADLRRPEMCDFSLVRSTGQCNTACSLSAGVWKPKVFRGRAYAQCETPLHFRNTVSETPFRTP